MKKSRAFKCLLLGLALSFTSQSFAYTPPYLTGDEYEEQVSGYLDEDRGIVIENKPELGYLVYRNAKGRKITASYYSSEMVVEKQPYYEEADRIGYIDELFPYFGFDPRDTTIGQIKPGDTIYLERNSDGDITYISAYSDYLVRYGRVQSWDMNQLILEDGQGRLYTYAIPMTTPITKAGKPYSLGSLKQGEWVKVLVSQKILGEGIVEEEVLELVVDPDTRVISDVYKGELLSLDQYKNTLNIRNAQRLQKKGWSTYTPITTLGMNPRTMKSYYLGNPVSVDYLARNLAKGGSYVYAAVESFMGKESAVKLNFQSKMQRTLEPSEVIYASPGVIKLLSGEQLFVSDDAIIVRDKRLVGTTGVMVGDTVQAVVTGENKLAVANVLDTQSTGGIQVFRGRIKYIKEYEQFEVETFSLLEDGLWYYHPTPRTFAIDGTTRFYTDEGFMDKGIDSFLGYGESSQLKEVYTIIAVGDQAKMIVDMPYSKEVVEGKVYETADGSIKIKDVTYYNSRYKRWDELSRKNVGATIKIEPNTMILKEGKVVSAKSLEPGDEVTVMLEKSIKGQSKPNADGNTTYEASGYLITVR